MNKLRMICVLCMWTKLIYAFPNEWSRHDRQDYQEENEEYVSPVYFGQLPPQMERRSSTDDSHKSIFSIMTDSIMAGFNYIDRAIPFFKPSKQNTISSYEFEDDGGTFVRSRRQENITEPNTTENPTSTTTVPTTTTTTIYAITTTEIPVGNIENNTKIQQEKLQSMINELNEALEEIKSHGNRDVKVQINQDSSIEDLVKHISFISETLTKTKDVELRRLKIKEITQTLNILLGRIAVSAKDLVKAQNRTTTNILQDKALMSRLVKHISEMKIEYDDREKLNSAIELTSAELDGGLPNLRQVRQEDDKTNDIDSDLNGDVERVPGIPGISSTAKPDVAERQQSGSSEEGGNLVANLISSFLGGLSTPTGGVDVDAIVGLVSGLSVQRDDGSYDFSGLTDLLQSFFGPDDSGGGGSDVGSFLGSLLGAILQGSANPPGAQGTGRFAGNLVASILPGLSGPPPQSSSEEEMNKGQPSKPIDSGSFIAGILTSMLGASSGTSSGSKGAHTNNDKDHNHDHDHHHPQHGSFDFIFQIKNLLVKALFSVLTKLLSASSAGATAASGASSMKQHHHHH